MAKIFHIGERCLFGTAKIEEITEGSVTMALYLYQTTSKKDEKIFYDTMSLIMWLGDKMDAFYADKIIAEIKKTNVKLQETSIW